MQIQDILNGIGQGQAVAQKRPPLPITPTRLIGFNTDLMKIGGMAGGRIYEFYAPPSAGKSTLAQIICADYQKLGKHAAYFDTEGTTQTETDLEVHKSWMETLGVETGALITPEFTTAEDVFHTVKQLVVLGVNVIVIDTIAVLRSELSMFREEEVAKMNEQQALPKALTLFFNELVGGFTIKDKLGKNFLKISEQKKAYLAQYGIKPKDDRVHKLWWYDCAIIGVNHAKTMIGVMYGDPTYTPGGASLGFQSSIRVGMSKPAKSKEKVQRGGYEVPLYRKTTMTAAKNKLAEPFGETTIRVYYDGRVEEDVPFAQLAEKKGLISVTSRNVTILIGEYKGTTMKKVDFETWVAENPAFLETVDDSFVAEEVPTVEQSPKKKLSLGLKLGH